MSRLLLASIVAVAACSEADEYCCVIDEQFEWGTATAAFQIEGGNTTSDWAQWEERCVLDEVNGIKDPRETITDCESNLDGPDAWSHFDADFAVAATLGNNAARIGLEWAKIEPTPGLYDAEVLAHYHAVLASARRHGLEPMVTLQHFTLPAWAHDLDNLVTAPGWAGADDDAPGAALIVSAFERFAGDMGEEYGEQVDLWITINEPVVFVLAAYLVGTFPPGEALAPERGLRAMFHMAHGHARAYDELHTRDRVDADGDGISCEVSVAKHWRILDPVDADNRRAVESARQQDYLFNRLFLAAVTEGRVDINGDGDLDDVHEGIDASVANRLDFLGINYYGRMMVYDSLVTVCDDGTCSPGEGVEVALLTVENDDPALPHSDLGWEIYPRGFTRVLEAAAEYGVPIRVTENGTADDDDDQRPGFIVAHVAAMEDAMAAGVEVRGYYHWSLVDNFEWVEGFAPRFGLLRVDYSDPGRHRSMTRAAWAYRAIIEAGGATAAIGQIYGRVEGAN